MPGRRLAGRWRHGWLGLLLVLAACGSTLDVRTLATERADLSAYELTGQDLDALRREAQRLCPQGGEILRQSARDQRLEPVDSRMQRWAHFSSRWISPVERQAQLVVLCSAATGRQLLAAAPAPSVVPPAVGTRAAASAAPTPPAAVAGAPAMPIGPLSVQW